MQKECHILINVGHNKGLIINSGANPEIFREGRGLNFFIWTGKFSGVLRFPNP